MAKFCPLLNKECLEAECAWYEDRTRPRMCSIKALLRVIPMAKR